MSRPTSESSVSAGRLRYDHRALDSRLVEMRGLAIHQGWPALLGSWTGFASDLVRHLAFEELAVFPGFARHKPGEADVIARLVDEHEHLRRLLDVIELEIIGGHADRLSLDGFASAMADHEWVENTRIDPWLELQDRRRDPGRRPS
jgi:hypothetical protein